MRVVVVEDHAFVLESLRLLLRGEQTVTSVHAFCSAEDALKKAEWRKVDILLADLELPGISGIELISEITTRFPHVNSLAYTVHDDRENVFAAIKAGASGYILKGSTPRELIEALQELHAGGAPMSPKVARKVIVQLQQQLGAAANGLDSLLSPREHEVLRRLEKGQSYKDVAAEMNISRHTVHSHIKRIYEKIQAGDRSEALRKARQRGLI